MPSFKDGLRFLWRSAVRGTALPSRWIDRIFRVLGLLAIVGVQVVYRASWTAFLIMLTVGLVYVLLAGAYDVQRETEAEVEQVKAEVTRVRDSGPWPVEWWEMRTPA